MSEKIPPSSPPEQRPDLPWTPEEERALVTLWLVVYKVREEKPPKRESGPEIERFEELIASFEITYSLEELHAITDLTPEDALNHPLREPAKRALNPIVVLLNVLREETDILEDRHNALKAEYKRLSRAVGIISQNKVDHTR